MSFNPQSNSMPQSMVNPQMLAISSMLPAGRAVQPVPQTRAVQQGVTAGLIPPAIQSQHLGPVGNTKALLSRWQGLFTIRSV